MKILVRIVFGLGILGANAGSILRITEAGEVSSPLYRVLSRVMGHHAGMEAYARDLGARLGETTTPVRVPA